MWFKHLRKLFNDCFIRFAFTLSASQVHMVKKWCGFVNIHIFPSICPHGSQILLLANQFDVTDFSQSKFQWSVFELSFPEQSKLWVTVPISLKKYHGIFNAGPWFLPFCVVEGVSKHQDIQISEFWAIWENLPNFSWAKQILRQLLVHYNLVIFQCSSHLGLRRVLFIKKMRALQSRLLQCLSQSTTLPLYFCNLGSNSEFYIYWQK